MMGQWLLETSVLERLDKAAEMLEPSNFEAIAPVTSLSLSDSGNTATIKVEGILTKKADPFMSLLYGSNTAYDDINAQLAMAENDSKVSNIVFDIDSPGGNVDGLFDTFAAINAVTKPMSVRARNAQSAAYGIAAAAGNITATGVGSMFGSVGTAISMHVSDNVITLASTNAPEKRPDPRTEDGRAAIIRHLDAIDDLFVGAIAEGRGISLDAVRQGYGRGASLLAGDAKERGMIDGIAGTGLRVVEEPKATAVGGSEDSMDIEQLKSEYPAVYKAAVETGVHQERERVTAHLKLAESGDLETALEAIKGGSDLTQTIYAAHMAAALNRRDNQSRDEDDDAVKDALNGASTKQKDDETFQRNVVERLEALVGNGAIENG
jgi:ClpP class serine protease